MPPSTDHTDESGARARPDRTSGIETATDGVPGLLGRVPRLGVWSWSFVGFVLAAIIVVTALAAVSEIVLPMTFAAVLAVVLQAARRAPCSATTSSPAWPPGWSSSGCSP